MKLKNRKGRAEAKKARLRLEVQVRSLLDAKYKTDNKITELKNKCASLEKDLEEMTQVRLLARGRPYLYELVDQCQTCLNLSIKSTYAATELKFSVLIPFSLTFVFALVAAINLFTILSTDKISDQ